MKFYLAPINVLSNNAFRKLCINYGVDFVFTEMVWAERILTKSEFEEKKLEIENQEKTIIQIIAEDEKNIEPFVKILRKRFSRIKELNYNMGCPQSTLSKKMIGGGILKDKEKMKKYSIAFSKACKKYGFKPSVKIRTGVNSSDLKSYIEIIKKAGIKKVYIHARTLTQGYVRPADYSSLKGINPRGIDIVVNGDIKDKNSLLKATSATKCGGVMIGRAALNDPSVFLKLKGKKSPSRKEIILKYLVYAKDVPMCTIKKNVSWMTQNIVFGSKIRAEVNNAKTIGDIKKIIIKNGELN